MEFLVEGPPRAKKFIESLLPNMITQLKLTRSRNLVHVMLDSDLQEQGTVVPFQGLNTFLIVLKPDRNLVNLGVTLAHELIHVAQFAKGILKVAPKGRLWRGKFYSNKTPYLYQPWEIQAFAKQELIMRRAIEL